MKKSSEQVFTIIGAISLMFLWVSSSRAAEYGGIGGRPANPDPAIPNSASWFIYSLPPGQLKEDALEVQNNSATTEDLVVYAADSTPSSDGGFALKQQVEPMTGIGTWITFYPEALPDKVVLGPGGIIELCRLQSPPSPVPDLPPLADDLQRWCQGKQTVEVRLDSLTKISIPFVISIPAQVDVGEHNGGVAIQKKSVERKEQGGSAVVLTTRVGVRVYETVPGDIIRRLRISKFLVQKNARLPEMTVILGMQNDGNVSLDATNELNITGLLWRGRDQTIKRMSQALRGEELVINTAWPPPVIGRYRFTASVSYQDGDQTRRLEAAPVVIWIVPWREVLIGLGIILLGLLVWLGRWILNRRRYKGYAWVSVTVKAGDTIASLAEPAGVSWKKIARMNRLRAPYHLTPGQSLQLFLPPSVVKRPEVQSTKPPKSKSR